MKLPRFEKSAFLWLKKSRYVTLNNRITKFSDGLYLELKNKKPNLRDLNIL